MHPTYAYGVFAIALTKWDDERRCLSIGRVVEGLDVVRAVMDARDERRVGTFVGEVSGCGRV